ncbi:hypothetical protein DSW25_10235 [Sulfitobacter donghicola DSW-25 = KCTC 12864 = JCM 14565]|uniref:Uncharacterized protein n=1 Tax=Sulfitobacter donghicola DSW-25 = KCTC 12864 = JCM 14565 TaxID=1300350 RepID=A0A073IIH9_9RHOB|nr:hypothetical protein DSW25_10235 [Sulfitobacter donghicola DSW-25 = KCTC 12864 = JCM 14565]
MLVLIWVALFAAYFLLDASAVVLAILGAFTLPAAFELAANPTATFSLDDNTIRWETGRQEASIALSEVDHLRFDTRLDMSVRLTVVRPSGVKIRVPVQATPPHAILEPLAKDAGVQTQRHHFSLLG